MGHLEQKKRAKIKVGAAALNQTPLDWEGNVSRIVQAIARARAESVALLCLPELCLTGYGCEDAFFSADLCRTANDILLRQLCPETKGMVVCIGHPIQVGSRLYNAVSVLADGKIEGIVCKLHLANDGVHYEPRWFTAWEPGRLEEVELGGKSYPCGDLFFESAGVRFGFEICEDAWVSPRRAVGLGEVGVDLVLNPSASHFALGKTEQRKEYVQSCADDFSLVYAYANLLGNEAGRIIYSGETLIAEPSRILARGDRFSFEDCKLITAVVSLGEECRSKQAKPAEEHPHLITCDFSLSGSDAELSVPAKQAKWEYSKELKEEEFTRAVSLGLFDYLRKSRARGYVVSLSGGVDSASCACLVSLMIGLGVSELGLEQFRQKLGVKGVGTELAQELLTCVYQATRNSSDVTRDAAATLAAALDARFLEFDVDQIVQSYTDLVSTELGREFSWSKDDLTLQNIQARTRGPGAWMLANALGQILVATSNRSEAAVGYTTMDGDTCGGLSPIAGIDKAFLREWLVWMEKQGPEGLEPIPELSLVNEQEPTAELRPLEQRQSDEGDLMPYAVLDVIERYAIRDKQAPLEVLKSVSKDFQQFSLEQHAEWVERFFNLWCRNQWKRERYAPCFHLDDENLDPKTWCRFPILSGGFVRELEQMWNHVRAIGAAVPEVSNS